MTQICPKCKGTKFVLQNIDIDNCNYPFVSIQFKTCGNSMGVTTFENVPNSIQKLGYLLEERINDLEKQINELKSRLNR